MNISTLRPDETNEAVELAVVCFGEAMRDFATEDFHATFETASNRPNTYAARQDGKIVGLVQSFTGYIHPNVRSFAWLATAPDYRRKGVAAALLNYAEQDTIEKIFKNNDGTFLLVSAINSDYYRSLGYEGGLNTYDGHPFMVKHHRKQSA